MKMNVIDSQGIEQSIIVKSQETTTDKSGFISNTGISQTLMSANSSRTGFVVQNCSVSNSMFVTEIGSATPNGGSFTILPGQFFPQAGFPTITGALTITGTANDKYTAREW